MSDISTRIETLNDWQLVAFTAALAERLFPNFSLFANVTSAANEQVLRTALDKVWDQLAHKASCNVETQLAKVEEETPDVERFDMYGVYPALDAAVAVTATLEQLEHPSAEEAMNILLLCEEGIATYLEVTADPDLSDEELVKFINTHELMDQQLSFTEELLDRLAAMENPSPAGLESIQILAENEGVSNIGICDED